MGKNYLICGNLSKCSYLTTISWSRNEAGIVFQPLPALGSALQVAYPTVVFTTVLGVDSKKPAPRGNLAELLAG